MAAGTSRRYEEARLIVSGSWGGSGGFTDGVSGPFALSHGALVSFGAITSNMAEGHSTKFI